MPGSQLCDHRGQFAQTDQPDLIRQLKDGGERPFTPVGWKGSERPGECTGAMNDTQCCLAQPQLPVSGREDRPTRIQLTREPLIAEDDAQELVVDNEGHSVARSASPYPSLASFQSASVTEASNWCRRASTPPGTRTIASPKSR